VRQHRIPVLLVALLFVLAACSSGGATPSPATPSSPPTSAEPGGSADAEPTPEPSPASITIALSQQIFSYSPLYVTQCQKFWDDENLTVEFVFFKSGSESQQAVLGDAVFLGAGGYTEPITLSAQGVPAVTFGFIEGALPYRLMTKPEITSVDQLEGKVLAVSRVGALSDQVTRIALNKVGYDPNKSTYQAAGGSPDRFAALQSGAVDGTVLDSPTYLLAEEAGFNTLVNLADELEGFPYELLWAKKDKIEQNKDIFLRFMRGYIQGATFLRDEANKDVVVPCIAKALGTDEETAALGWETTLKDFPPDGEINKDGLQQALEGTQQYGSIPGTDQVTVDDLYYPDIQQEAAASLK
jgi:NitT/TauT family transport system substrate-binding protein